MNRKIKILLVPAFLLWATFVFGQSVKSPYTIFGVGDLSFEGLTQNLAMGDLAIGYSSQRNINLHNPAWLYRNALSTFQVALEGEYRNFATAETAEGTGAAGLRYLAFTVPLIKNRLSTSFGVLPFSTVNYNVTSSQTVEASGVDYKVRYVGEGGLTQIYWSNGLRLTESLGIGVKARYVFGRIDNENVVLLDDGDLRSPYTSAFVEQYTFSDFNFTTGLSYRKKIIDKSYINAGLTYELAANISGKRMELLERRSLGDQPLRTDTLSFNEKVIYKVPNSLGVGISYERLNKFIIGVDFKMQDWVENGGFEGGTSGYRKTLKFSVGGELIPAFDDVNSYIKRVAFRAGVSYKQLPYLVKNVKINDFGINFGGSFPVGGVSSLDLALKLGQRGTIDNELIRERYFKFVFGATINDRWFIRRKYD